MRVILLSHPVAGPGTAVADGVLALRFFEDLSVGPLAEWRDPPRFRQARRDFWAGIPEPWLKDAEVREYWVWVQFHPCDVPADPADEEDETDGLAGATLVADLGAFAPTGARFELWADPSVRGCLMLWYAMAELTRLGVPLAAISQCRFPPLFRMSLDAAFWQRALMDAPDRAVPAVAITAAERDHWLRCWQAAIALPAAVPADLLQDPGAGPVLRLLAGRFPDPGTGLSNLQTRLLQATPTDWVRMAYMIGDALAVGDKAGDPVGDLSLHAELTALAHRQPALVELAGAGAMQATQVRLTPEGQRLRARLARD